MALEGKERTLTRDSALLREFDESGGEDMLALCTSGATSSAALRLNLRLRFRPPC